jgi:hypothetical protein
MASGRDPVVVIPVCVAMTMSTIAGSPPASAAFRSFSSTALKGGFSFHSGWSGASAFTRSIANRNWK